MGVQKALVRGFREKSVVTDSVRDGKEALTRISKNNYDLAVIDLMLPNINGEDIIRKIREVGMRLPVLVLTAFRGVHVKARLLEAGADDFLEKPFSFEELYARISAILRRSHNSELTENIRAGELELIPERKIIKRGDKEITLRAKEFALLAYFMKNPNRILSRQAIMENVWGYSTSILSNTVDSHIFTLRRKIDKGHSKKHIKTVHGSGYMFLTG